jgi:tetratricopeptide (TPR) repeat protein
MSNAPFLERARLEREQEREASARLALGGYVVARLVERLLTAEDTAESRQAIRWQIEAVRRHVRELPPDLPETAHLRGITEAVPIDGRPLAGLRLSIMAYAYFLEHEARLEEALQALALAVRTYGQRVPPADFATTALFAGRLNRLLTRWPEATSCYGAAEAAADAVGDLVLALRSRLGRSAVLRGQGNLPAAVGMAEDVARLAAEANLGDVEAMAWADIGAAHSVMGKRVEAVHALYQAFRLTEDALQRMRLLGDLGVGLRELGAQAEARLAFEIVVASKTSFLVRTNALLELMALESAVGNRMSFQRRRVEAEEVRDRMPPSMLTDYHFKTGQSLARFGQTTRARAMLAAGLDLAKASHLNAWYFRFEEALANLSGGESRKPEHLLLGVLDGSPAVQEVAVGLREYALLAT